jgi:hypothetical protein
VSVGRGRFQRIVRDMQKDAHQIVARLFGRNREASLVDDLAKGRGRKLEAGGKIALRNYREVVARQRR